MVELVDSEMEIPDDLDIRPLRPRRTLWRAIESLKPFLGTQAEAPPPSPAAALPPEDEERVVAAAVVLPRAPQRIAPRKAAAKPPEETAAQKSMHEAMELLGSRRDGATATADAVQLLRELADSVVQGRQGMALSKGDKERAMEELAEDDCFESLVQSLDDLPSLEDFGAERGRTGERGVTVLHALASMLVSSATASVLQLASTACEAAHSGWKVVLDSSTESPSGRKASRLAAQALVLLWALGRLAQLQPPIIHEGLAKDCARVLLLEDADGRSFLTHLCAHPANVGAFVAMGLHGASQLSLDSLPSLLAAVDVLEEARVRSPKRTTKKRRTAANGGDGAVLVLSATQKRVVREARAAQRKSADGQPTHKTHG